MKDNTLILFIILTILAGVVLAKAEEPGTHTYLQIACSEAVYTNPTFSNKMETAWSYIIDSDDFSDLWAGWLSYYRSSINTNITVYVYRNSLKNIKLDLVNSVTPDQMIKIKDKIKEMPQVEASINKTPNASLASWNVERKPK